jgi:hypothetical protein
VTAVWREVWAATVERFETAIGKPAAADRVVPPDLRGYNR